MRKAFEYKIISVEGRFAIKEANNLGKTGWELVSAFVFDTKAMQSKQLLQINTLWFKREKLQT